MDPHLVNDARDRLTQLCYTATTLAAVDGIKGLPEHAPFDRIIATCALFAVPAAWIHQLRPEGLALVHLEGPLGAGNLLALRHIAPDTVQGRFLPWWGCFMRRRPTAGPSVGTRRPRRTDTAPTTRTTMVDPTQLDGGARFPFLAQLHLPPGVFRSIWRRDPQTATTPPQSPNSAPLREFGVMVVELAGERLHERVVFASHPASSQTGKPAGVTLPVRGELLTRLGRTGEARTELELAVRLCGNERERAVL